MPRLDIRHRVSTALAASLVALLTVALTAHTAFIAPATARAADPDPVIEGIDVSHWQGDIDWSQVGAADKRFAFMKASEDTAYVDPTYGLNRARARAAGLVVGAYHYAQPNATAGDAEAEADHFLDTAGLAKGDLPPVLDLEEDGGLSDAALTAWVRAYVERIHERTGVRTVIYASPSFWSSQMGGTDWFATNDYRVVWVAHWTTAASPTVPASDWAGFGWTFWQYTSSGSVAGIDGRVDLDRFAGSDLKTVLIDPTGGETPDSIPKPPFTDIRTSKFLKDIAWLYGKGITAGCSATRFCPDGRVTRGQMASFLARALDLPKTSKDFFADDKGSTHEADINRLAKAGLTSGCSATHYCPDDPVSRGQLASFLARVLDLSATTKDYFRDDATSIHEANINRIARAGLTNGCSATRYCPTGIVTRGQMAAFLHRTFGD
jgi:GH25 family lysozyme M1 (1,4-beta-N-acetylmuramidase)